MMMSAHKIIIFTYCISTSLENIFINYNDLQKLTCICQYHLIIYWMYGVIIHEHLAMMQIYNLSQTANQRQRMKLSNKEVEFITW